jgi:hypothetical protein
MAAIDSFEPSGDGQDHLPRKEGQELFHFQNLDEILTHVLGWKFVDFLKEMSIFLGTSSAERSEVLSCLMSS